MTPLALNPQTIDALAEALLQRCADSRRYLLGIAGIPGSGKSTLAQQLLEAMNRRQSGVAALVPMDGFHLSNAELDRLGLRQRKGAPQTFDVTSYLDLLGRIRDNQPSVYFPVYDRGLHEPVLRQNPQQCVNQDVRLVITEGNYLLLDEEPWRALADLLDECWLLRTDEAKARQWIIARHVRGGRAPDDAQRHYDRSDRLNVEVVLSRSRRPDRLVAWEEISP